MALDRRLALLICIENVSWEGAMEDIRGAGSASEMLQETRKEKGPNLPGAQRMKGPGAARGLGCGF